MLDGHTLDAAGQVGFPVGLRACHRINAGTFLGCEVFIPAQVHQHLHGELRVAVLNVGILGVHAIGQQVIAVMLNTEAGAESQAALGHR